ncbi:MAG: hydroxyacid dehydrogenase [Chloroflexi bacterium]|nr:hydroxyacid dehydrogenase [Chloroflexota bacterium]
MSDRPQVGLAANKEVRERDVAEEQLRRLTEFAEFHFRELNEPTSWDQPPPRKSESEAKLVEFAQGLDALIVCHGAPRITGCILDKAPRVKFVGELEGDRFAQRIDAEACWERGVKAVDTTHGSSFGVSEWALAMGMIGLRNAGYHFRRMINHEVSYPTPQARLEDPGYLKSELSDRTVGLIGCGHIGRRLLELLRPFRVKAYVHDPYVPREIADIYDVTLTSLENLLRLSEVVFCLAPITPATRKMIGKKQIELLRPGAVFVNVSRGAIVDSEALIERLRRNDMIACLDVFDPEPVPLDSPVRDLPNVFLTPHIAGVNARGGPRFFELMVDELARFFHGHETRNDLLPRTLANRTGAPSPAR